MFQIVSASFYYDETDYLLPVIKMKKEILALGISVLLLVSLAAAQEIGEQGPLPKIHVLHMLGKGIAVSTTDPADFQVIKVSVATVKMAGEELTTGILFLNGERYKLKDIQSDNGTVSSNVYSNDTQVGSFSASLAMKGPHRTWVGTLTVNENSYNIYVLEADRPAKPKEIGEKIENLCEKFPAKCINATREIKGKLKDFCENNPGDQRCGALFREFCKNNLQDTRCVQALKEYCEDRPLSEPCLNFEYKATRKFCAEHPLNPQCTAVRDRLSKLPHIAENLRKGQSIDTAIETTEANETAE